MLDASKSVTHQRARGRVLVGFEGANNRLVDLHQSGSLKALLPRNHAPVPDVVLVNTAGGLTGGDDYAVSAYVRDGAEAVIATQTAERVYKASADVASMSVSLTLSGASTLSWMPQETILFDNSAIARNINVDMDAESRLLIVEPIVFGRRAMGEDLTSVSFSDQWRIRVDGRLTHAEATRIEGEVSDYRGLGCLGDAVASATILYIGPDAQARLPLARNLGLTASSWEGRLVVRFLDSDARHMRAKMIEFLTLFRGTEMPRVWTM